VFITVNVVAWGVFIVDLLVHMRYIRHYLRRNGGFDLVVVISPRRGSHPRPAKH
jgi:hypothetical protein